MKEKKKIMKERVRVENRKKRKNIKMNIKKKFFVNREM
jgi:hypothetical protein